MDKLQQVKAKLEEMKAKYNFERENEDNPNHSDGWGMFYSGFFTCLKEISFFVEHLEVREVDLVIHTIIAECCDWLAMNTNLGHDKIEGCRNLMLTVKEEQFKAQKGE